jgi:hypothetical protein
MQSFLGQDRSEANARMNPVLVSPYPLRVALFHADVGSRHMSIGLLYCGFLTRLCGRV